jgi:hypothetical protein
MLSVPQVIRATGIPAFVKSAAAIPADGTLNYNTRETTYVSFVTALVKGASAAEWQDCADHVKFWGIEQECAQAKAKYAELMQTPELTLEDYALVARTGNGQLVKKYAAYDGGTTAQAAVAFYEQRDAYPYEWRADAAARLLNKAARYQAVLPEYVQNYLEKAAAFGAVGEKELEDAIVAREQACPSEYRDTFAKIAELAEQLLAREDLRSDHDFIKSAMATIDHFDAMIHYDGELIEEAIPGDLTVSNLQKIAGDMRFEINLINGLKIDVRQLEKKALAAIDPDLAYKSDEQLIDILPTLPKPDADLLARILA